MPEEPEFLAHLRATAEAFGFPVDQQAAWVAYMADLSRGQQLVERLVQRWGLEPGRGGRALDVGCGFGGLALALQARFPHVAGIDQVAERVSWARRRAPGADLVVGDAAALPWPEGRFELVVSNDVLEHVPFGAQRMVVREIFRVLRPGGVAFLAVPNRLQVTDEHNRVPFGTWLPSPLRSCYARRLGPNRRYLRCYERTGAGWQRLCAGEGFSVAREGHAPFRGRRWLPYQRWDLYLRKPA